MAEAREEILVTVLKELLPSFQRYSVNQVKSKMGKAQFEDVCNQVFDFMESSCGKQLQRNEQLALLSQILRCLQRYVTNRLQIPFTASTIYTCIHELRYAVDLSFPGYASSGLLMAVIAPRRLSELLKAS